MATVQSTNSVSSNINNIKNTCSDVGEISIKEDETSQFSGNETVKQVIDTCKNCLNQIKQGTDRYEQTIGHAKDAFEKTDANNGKHFMNSGDK